MKWAMITDLHFGVRGDSKIWHQHFEEFYTNQFIPYLKENDIQTLFILGDVFERRKQIGFDTLEVIRRVLFDAIPCKNVYFLAGNHDVAYKNTNDLCGLELLLTDYPQFKLFKEPEVITVDGVGVLMLPWINKENMTRSTVMVMDADVRFVMSHLELKGFEFSRGVQSEHGHIDVELLNRFEGVFSGHYHHKSSKGSIHYLGTPYELTWTDYDDPRGFHVLDDSGLNFIENPKTIFMQLIYDDSNPKTVESFMKDERLRLDGLYVKIIVKGKHKPKMFERFVDHVLGLGVADVVIIDHTTFMTEMPDEEMIHAGNTVDVMNQYVDGAIETDLSKDVLKRKLHELYVAANNV